MRRALYPKSLGATFADVAEDNRSCLTAARDITSGLGRRCDFRDPLRHRRCAEP
jgi:hypothetical protein